MLRVRPCQDLEKRHVPVTVPRLIYQASGTTQYKNARYFLRALTGWFIPAIAGSRSHPARACFVHRALLTSYDLAIWTVGRMSARRLLAWLASPSMQHCQYTHWGDYDPVGVAEYIRLRDACRDRVTMWIPDNLESLLRQHGRQSLLLKRGNLRVYSRLRHMTAAREGMASCLPPRRLAAPGVADYH